VIVTHNMQQAARVSDFTAFLLTGQIIEFSPTPHLFTTPSDPRTEAYITGVLDEAREFFASRCREEL